MSLRIRGGMVVAYDPSRDGHVLLREGTVVTDGARIRYVGPDAGAPPPAPGASETVVDARGRLVMPGLIDAHLHAGTNATDYLLGDVTRGDYLGAFFLSSGAPLVGRRGRQLSPEQAETAARFSLAHAIKCGATTIMEAGGSATGPARLARIAEELGLRAYLARGFRSAQFRTDAEGRIFLEHDEERGRRELAEARAFVAEHDRTCGDRIRAYILPRQIDTCSVELLRAARESASELGVPLWIHGALNLREFYWAVTQHRCTPIELLGRIGFLGPDVLVAHAVFLAGHSWTRYPDGRDLELLADSGATLIHAPLKYAKSGMALESFERCRRAGVRLCLGTDTWPYDMVREMYYTTLACRIVDGDHRSAQPRDVFDAATLGAARALGRPDLGRLAPGAMADVVVVDLNRLQFGAFRDPVRALIECGSGADVETVVIDGRVVVDAGRLTVCDEAALLADARRVAEAEWAAFPESDWAGRSADDMVPPSYPWADGEPGSGRPA
jgi:5-methylthioadenosine/S-adenosylhomocysteine deaminase